MPKSPTARTLEVLRDEGWIAAVVEHWNPHARCRQDLFGFIDVLAIWGPNTLAVQATSGANHANRRAKLLSEKLRPTVRGWLNGGTRSLEVWSWAKRGARGERKVWQCRKEPIRLEDLS